MMRKIHTYLHLSRSSIACAAALCVAVASPAMGDGEETKPEKKALPPGVIFSAPLPDVPGKNLVVVELKIPPAKALSHGGHRHPGSVYVYVTEGIVRFGIEGQPVKELRVGESFFEPPGAVHTVMESASSTQPASVIAVMIVPDGEPLVLPAKKEK